MKLQKTLLTAVLAGGLLGITGCDEGTNAAKKYYIPGNNEKPCEFTNFGYVPWSWERNGANASVAVGDMNGDGALDIIVSDASGRIIIYQNKIHQQNKKADTPRKAEIEY